jgi:hypothetical protein
MRSKYLRLGRISNRKSSVNIQAVSHNSPYAKKTCCRSEVVRCSDVSIKTVWLEPDIVTIPSIELRRTTEESVTPNPKATDYGFILNGFAVNGFFVLPRSDGG